MGLYLGSKKKKLKFNGTICSMNITPAPTIFNGIRLLSSEGYILKDLNGLYLTAKEDK